MSKLLSWFDSSAVAVWVTVNIHTVKRGWTTFKMVTVGPQLPFEIEQANILKLTTCFTSL